MEDIRDTVECENWQEVWHGLIAPHLPTAGLLALAEALKDDDPRLVQRAVVRGPAGPWAVPTAACAIGFCCWQGEELQVARDVEDRFVELVCKGPNAGRCAEVSRFLRWFDHTPRDEMRSLLLAEVERTLTARTA